jgi:AraC family transcriptional regulator of adaptative response / DNA-3-methyladenine glycosylase II
MAPSGRFAVVEERLAYRPPFDGEALLRFLARRAIPGVEEVDGETYRRSLSLPSGPGTVELSLADGSVRARIEAPAAPDCEGAITIARALFDLDADPQAIASVLRRDALLAPLLEAAPGRRQPGSADAAELAARAVLGQQVSLEAAVTLAARLVADYGEPLDRPVGSVTHLFPSAVALASADPERLAMPGARRRALLGLCAALAAGDLVLEPGTDLEAARGRLLALPGVGPWTAEYVAMRALGDVDALPATDLGLRRALERLGEDPSPDALRRRAETWRPYRAYGAQYLWSALDRPTAVSRRPG